MTCKEHERFVKPDCAECYLEVGVKVYKKRVLELEAELNRICKWCKKRVGAFGPWHERNCAKRKKG